MTGAKRRCVPGCATQARPSSVVSPVHRTRAGAAGGQRLPASPRHSPPPGPGSTPGPPACVSCGGATSRRGPEASRRPARPYAARSSGHLLHAPQELPAGEQAERGPPEPPADAHGKRGGSGNGDRPRLPSRDLTGVSPASTRRPNAGLRGSVRGTPAPALPGASPGGALPDVRLCGSGLGWRQIFLARPCR